MAKVMRGIQRELREAQYSALFVSHHSRDEELECYQLCKDHAVEGMIVNPGFYANGSVNGSTGAGNTYLDSIGKTPVVEIFGRAVRETPAVNIDEFATGRQATEHLLSLGHRHIAMFTHDRYEKARETGAGNHADAWHRYEGYRQAMLDAGGEPLVFTHAIHSEFDWEGAFVEGGLTSLATILHHPSKPTAVICMTDWQAMGLIRAAEMQKIDLPSQLSVIGYGDVQAATLLQPRLTTFSVPAFEVGHARPGRCSN